MRPEVQQLHWRFRAAGYAQWRFTSVYYGCSQSVVY
jgi:hypothetical protein